MQHMTAEIIAKAVGGRILWGDPQTPVLDICTDSRQAKGGELYVPILGERVDGHRFIEGALRNGAIATFTSQHDKVEDLPESVRGVETNAASAGILTEKGVPAGECPCRPADLSATVWIRVDDTRGALQTLGKFCRSRLDIPFVGVTGSVGKTSTRTMIATALAAGFHTFQTAGNANSQVGVPITLSRITEDYEAAVIELGMSEPGEMARIGAIAGLDVAVMTNIGISHIEQLGSQANILREKLHITDGLAEDGWLILNGDDAHLCPQNAHKQEGASVENIPELQKCVKKYKTRYYGLQPHNDYRASDIRAEHGKTLFTLHCAKGEYPVALSVIGMHHVQNALAALACADVLGLPLNDAAAALIHFGGVAHRQETIALPAMGITVIDDSYNASPDSMRAAITALQMTQTQGRKIAVLADMWELGPETLRHHYGVGQAVGASEVQILVTVGPLSVEMAKGAAEQNPNLQIVSVEDRFQAAQWLEEHHLAGDLILFKGSNGMKLFEIIEKWKEVR